MRLFVAIEVPEGIRSAAAEAAAELKGRGVSLVSAERMHFTLVFMPSIDEPRLDSIRQVMASVAVPETVVRLSGLACFGNPGAIYAEAREGSGTMADAADSLRRLLAEKRIFFDDKKFVPHMTVARIRQRVDANMLEEFIDANRGRDFGSFRIRGIALFGGELGSRAPYAKLYER